MRIVRRLVHAAIVVLVLLVGATTAIVIVSQTAWFKNWLRGYITREASQYLNGTLSIGRLGGNLFFGLELEDIAVSMDGNQVVTVKDLGLDYSVFELISKGLAVDNIRLNQPLVYLRRDGDGWTISRLIKKQEQEADRRGPARPISIGAVDITDGSVVVHRPAGTSGIEVPKRFEHLDANLGFTYEPVRYTIDIRQVSFRGSSPEIALNTLSGGISVQDDTVYVEQLALRTAETSLSVDGAIKQYLTNPTVTMQVSSDKFSLPEVARLVPALDGIELQPAFELKLNGPIDRLAVGMNVRSSAGQVNGNVVADLKAPGQSLAGAVSIRDLDLSAIQSDARRKSDITADVTLDVHGKSLSEVGSLSGTVSVDAPRIVAAGFAAEQVKANARLDGRRVAIDGHASAYGSTVTAAGRLVLPEELSGPLAFDLRGQAKRVNLQRLPRSLNVPAAVTNINGQYRVAGSRVDSSAGSGRSRIEGDLQFAPSSVAGAAIAAGSTAAFTIDGRNFAYQSDATVENLDLRRVGTEFRVPALTDERYKSVVNGQIVVSGSGRTPLEPVEMVLAANGTLRDTAIMGGLIPQLAFDVTLQHDTAELKATGAFAGFDPAVVSRKPAIKGTIGGTIDVDATVTDVSKGVTPDSVRATVRALVAPSSVGGVEISAATVDGDYRNAVANIRAFDVTGRDLNVQASGTLALNEAAQSGLKVHADSPNLEEVGKILGQPLAGIATTDLTVTGNKRELQVGGTVVGSGVKYGNDDKYGALTLSSEVTAKLPNLDVAAASISATTTGTFVTISGQNINELTAKTDYLKRQVTFDATAKQPQRTMAAAGSLVMHPDHQELHLQRLALTTQGLNWQTAAGSEATIQYGSDRVTVKDFALVNGDQRISLDGTFGQRGDSLNVTATNVDVGMVDALLLRPPQLSGRLNANAAVTGTTDAPQADAEFTIAQGGFRAFKYDSFGGTVNYSADGLAVDTKLQQNPTTWIEARGQVPTALFDERGWTSNDPIDLRIDSTPIDAGLIQGFTPALTDVTGVFEAHVHLTGTAADPRPDGAITVENAAFTLESNGVSYTDLDGQIELQSDRIHIGRLRVLDNHSSPLTVTGDLALRERTVGEMSIAVTAEDFKVIDNEIGNVRVDTSLQLTGQLNAPRIEGDLGVTTGEINLDPLLALLGDSAYSTIPTEYVTVADNHSASTPPSAPAAAGFPALSGLTEALQVDVRVTVPNDLIIKADDLRPAAGVISLGALNVTLGGDLYLHQVPYDQLRLYGAVNTVRGTYTFQGRQFTILRDGAVRFDGLDDFNPELDIRAERTIQAVTANVNVRGSFKQPDIILSSVPPLEQADILSLIVFNQPINQLGAGEQLSLAQRAQALATGAVANQLARSIGNALNLDIFEITTSPDSGADAALTIGQQVGQNLYVKVQQGIGDQSQTNFILEYELTDWLRLQTNVLEGSSTQQQLFQRVQGSGVNLLFFFSY